jgi:hypothetical protein
MVFSEGDPLTAGSVNALLINRSNEFLVTNMSPLLLLAANYSTIGPITGSTAFFKGFEITLDHGSCSQLLMKWSHDCNESAKSCQTRAYLNGTAIGTIEHTDTEPGWETESYTYAGIKSGDALQLYGISGVSGTQGITFGSVRLFGRPVMMPSDYIATLVASKSA